MNFHSVSQSIQSYKLAKIISYLAILNNYSESIATLLLLLLKQSYFVNKLVCTYIEVQYYLNKCNGCT